MFEITFEDQIHRHWSSGFVFEHFADAKDYLIKQGFIEKNRLFVRENYNWSLYLKAYISPVKIYVG